MKTRIHIRRVYDAPTPEEGYRVFVDRLWPRGISREAFTFDLWCKDLAPTPALRTWFGHKVEHWDQFRAQYEQELRTPEQQARMLELASKAGREPITLIYGAKDREHNHALILAAEMNRVLQHRR